MKAGRSRLTTRERDLSTLAARVDRLEAALAAKENKSARQAQSRSTPKTALGIMDDLSKRRGLRFTRADATGAFSYAGWLSVADRRYAWTKETGVSELIDADAAAIARWLSAIASPARIALIRELLGRDRSSTELVQSLSASSPGPVYHHLNELQAVGLVAQVKRGVYRIVPHALIPVLIVLAGANDVLQSRSGDAAEPFPATATGKEPTT